MKQIIDTHIAAFRAMLEASLPNFSSEQLTFETTKESVGGKSQTTIHFSLSATMEQEKILSQNVANNAMSPSTNLEKVLNSWMTTTSHIYNTGKDHFLWMTLKIGNGGWVMESPIDRFRPRLINMPREIRGGAIVPKKQSQNNLLTIR